MSKKRGYARCSLAEEKGQDLNRQVRELKAAGAEEIITEREHGDAKVKENLEMLLEISQSGDTLICCEVSRLSRSTQQLCEIINIILQFFQSFILLFRLLSINFLNSVDQHCADVIIDFGAKNLSGSANHKIVSQTHFAILIKRMHVFEFPR